MLAETLREVAGTVLVDEDGNEEALELSPPATDAQIAEAEAAFSVALPTELRDALRLTTGVENAPIDLSFLDHAGFGMEEVFPNAYSLGQDGFGNFWVLDLLPDRDECGPVFYACHDPPVIAFQSASPSDFIRDVVGLHGAGSRSPIDVVHEDVSSAIWASKSGCVSRDEAQASDDRVLSEFASGLPPEAVVADLREAKVGDGFPWALFGPRTEWQRAGAHRLWAAVPQPRRGLLSRLFGRGGRG